ncbi:MAG: hypothetical protein N3B16_10940 [Candidatus Aminicenantes bacterium]|nr:hypothetical protein [Candidatus Aminicenantes bacterium]
MTKAIKRRLRKATSKMLPANKVFLFGLIFLMIFQSIVGPSKSSILVQPVGLAQNKDELKQIQINLSPDLILHLKARHFRPGEIILAQLKSEECFSRSWINFEGQKFPFQREKLADGFLFYGLIGLDG